MLKYSENDFLTNMLRNLWPDVRFAVRILLRRPFFLIVSVITLACGIGINTAMFSVVNGILLTALPFRDPSALVVIWRRAATRPTEQSPESPPNYQDIKQQSTTFEEVAAVRAQPMILDDGDQPERLTGVRASTNLLKVLGVQPVLGRDFHADEDQPSVQPVVLISHSLWQTRFAGRSDAIGRSVSVDGKVHTIIGVLPPGTYYPTADVNVYVPLVLRPVEVNRGQAFLRLVGRLKPSVSLKQAQTEFETIAARLGQQYPDVNKGVTYSLVSLHEQVVGNLGSWLWVLWGAAGFVLLIACVNVANLLLAKGSARSTEFAIRTALGISRIQLVRQLLIESLLLSLAGAVFGLVLAVIGVRGLVGLAGENIPRVENIGLDARALGFAILIAIVTAVIFGVIPALQSFRMNTAEALTRGTKGTTGSVLHQRLLSSLVVSEIAIALILLIGAGLLVRSFVLLNNLDPGFKPQGVTAIGIGLPLATYPDLAKQASFYDRVTTEVRTRPDVESVAIANRVPMLGGNASSSFTIQARPVRPEDAPTADYRITSEDYFKSMGIPITKGRDFDNREMKDAPPVALINEKLAALFFPNEDPLGQRIQIGPEATRWREIVGVVGDVKLMGLDVDVNPTIYVPLPQNPYPNALRNVYMVVRSKGDAGAVVPAIRDLVRSMDRSVPISTSQNMDQIVWDSMAHRRLSVFLLVVFAGLATLLAVVGIYGVMTFIVAQRTKEIGIRMSVGASKVNIVTMILGDGAKLAFLGIAIGLGAAFGLTRLMRSLLFGISTTDIATFAIIPLLLVIVALVASLIPARRAASIDPLIAIRDI
jgi:putative ABC transport system permease protein